jgi:hypothetical protein
MDSTQGNKIRQQIERIGFFSFQSASSAQSADYFVLDIEADSIPNPLESAQSADCFVLDIEADSIPNPLESAQSADYFILDKEFRQCHFLKK